MSNKIIIYAAILIIGVVLGAGIVYSFVSDTLSEDHLQTSEEQLYSCGMHPNIVEKEPGTCPICGMNLTPIKNNNNKNSNSGDRKIIYWRAPMNPNEIYDEPGKSKMGMDLVPVYEDEGAEQGVVTVDGSIIQSMNIKLSEVENRKLNTSIYTNGILTTDERKEFILSSKISGWVEKLYVNYVGQKITKGQKLVDIYSPELIAAQQELITALNFNKNVSGIDSREIVQNAITKLELLDIGTSDIDELVKTKKVRKYLPLYAPFSGTVLIKDVIEGEKISPNKQLMKIADLRNLWLKADVYESELSNIKVGSEAEVRFDYLPGKVFTGKVSFIYPTVDPVSRTISVRIDLPNKNNELKPAMFANVTIKGNEEEAITSIPESSVIRSGKKNIVVIGLGDGRFKPVEITLGSYSEGYYQVLDGIKVNDKIVTSGQFMLDSESSLRSAINLLSSTDSVIDNSNMSKKINKESHEQNGNSDSIIRMGVIDLHEIDANGDGRVFQDPMDWNVISDEDGRCPVCGMFLKEVTIDEAKRNLDENGFKYK